MARRALLLILLAVVGCGAWYTYIHSYAYTDEGLAAYVAAERLDPLFAIEGTDPDKLTNAVTEFLSVRDRIAAQYPDDQKKSIVSLYPAHFLTLLSQLERERQALLATPTIEHARTYHAALLETMRAYADDADRVAALIRATADAFPHIEYVAGAADPQDTAQKIESVATAVRTVQMQKESDRFACLTNAMRCLSPAALMAARAAAIEQPATLPTPTAAIRQVAELTKTLNSAYRSYVRTEPVLFAVVSSCVASSSTAYIQTYYLSNQHGVARKLTPVTDAYFYDVQAEHDRLPTTPVYGWLLHAGITWQYQNAGNMYECPDAGFDQASVGSLLGTLNWLHTTHATSSDAQTILSRTVVSKADLASYLQQFASVDSPETNAVVERYLEGSSDFDQVVLGALNDNGFLLASTSAQKVVPPYQFVVAVRNYASTLFLMGNPTVVPQPQSLFLSHEAPDLSHFYLRSYLHDLSRTVSDAALIAQYKKSLDLQYPTTP